MQLAMAGVHAQPVLGGEVQIANLISTFEYNGLTLSQERKIAIGEIVEQEITNETENLHEANRQRIQLVQNLANGLLDEKEAEIIRLTEEVNEQTLVLVEHQRALQFANNEMRTLTATVPLAGWNAITELKRRVGTDQMTKKELVSFIAKTAGEIFLSILEPFAAAEDGNTWKKWAGVSVGVIVLLLCVMDMVKGCQENECIVKNENGCIVKKKLKLRRINWLDVYEVVISIVTIILYSRSFKTRYSLHLALYPCVYSFCMIIKEVVRCVTAKKRDYEMIAVPQLVDAAV